MPTEGYTSQVREAFDTIIPLFDCMVKSPYIIGSTDVFYQVPFFIHLIQSFSTRKET
ncbi:hypothetical protein RV18_GL002131 [Enterococcus termitis]|nr:hypothetical protein RV18_GL002131 [Enterococcus termitis]